jgi:hypothetical protein
MANENMADLTAAPVQPGMDVQASREFVQWPWAASISDGSRQRGDGREMRNWETWQRWISAQTCCRTREPRSRTLTLYPSIVVCKKDYRRWSEKAVTGLDGAAARGCTSSGCDLCTQITSNNITTTWSRSGGRSSVTRWVAPAFPCNPQSCPQEPPSLDCPLASATDYDRQEGHRMIILAAQRGESVANRR